MVQLRLSLVECDMICNAFCTHVCYDRSSSPLVTWSGTTLNYNSPSTRWIAWGVKTDKDWGRVSMMPLWNSAGDWKQFAISSHLRSSPESFEQSISSTSSLSSLWNWKAPFSLPFQEDEVDDVHKVNQLWELWTAPRVRTHYNLISRMSLEIFEGLSVSREAFERPPRRLVIKKSIVF